MKKRDTYSPAVVGDHITTWDGKLIAIQNDAQLRAFQRAPAKFLEAEAHRAVAPTARELAAADRNFLEAVLPKRGRPSTGVTPAKDRSAKAKAELIKAGGRRFNANLPPEAAEALETIKKRLGEGATATDAVVHALRETAKRRRA